ncbi:MAG: NAD-dependent epimerase/dehydratase family protein, partial [Myxococcota bacterium]
MRIVVTGGAGYVGSVAVEELIGAGHEVIVFDNLSTGHRAAVHPRATFVHGDLADRPAIDRVMAEHRPEAVMHFAARSLVGESYRRPLLYLRDNILCGINLFESALDHGASRIILSSTANLFGAAETMPIAEDERVAPGSPYGESKHALERCLYWLEQSAGCRYACLRYFNASGASAERGEDHDPETHLIPIVLQVALGQRERIAIFGNDYPTA